MKIKRLVSWLSVMTVLAVACGSATQRVGTQVDFADSAVAQDAYMAAPSVPAAAVAGYEASPLSAQVEPALGPSWELTEGHMTIVGYDETR